MTDRLPEQPTIEQTAEPVEITETVEKILAAAHELETATPAETEVTKASEPQPAELPARQPVSRLQKSITPIAADPLTLSVEKIMEEDVAEAYSKLSPIAKQEFKMRGEQAAKTIRSLMQSAKLQVKKVFHLILHWLKLLPGINRFFLEQEAKIKTDRIILLHQEHKEKMYAA